MDGFKTLLAGVTRLNTHAQRLAEESLDKAVEYAVKVTQDLEDLWPDLLRFLSSMQKEKRSATNQIAYVSSKLAAFVPSFQKAAEEAEFDTSQSFRSSITSTTSDLPAIVADADPPAADADLHGGYAADSSPSAALAEQL